MRQDANKAQRELQALHERTREPLNQAQQQMQLSQAKRDIGSPRSLDKDGDGEAEFATPEALATAVGASFILGPVGGILLGVAQGILGKQAKQGILDQLAAEQSALSDSQDIIQGQLDSFRLATDDENNLAQLSAIESNMKLGYRLAQAGNPKGLEMMQSAGQSLEAYAQLNEEQAIASQEAERQRRVDLDNEQYNRHSGLLDDYDAQSANFETVNQKNATAREMINRGNPVDIKAALIQVNKALDPISVVKPEEAQALGNVGTLYERGLSLLDEAIGSGQGLSDTQRKELLTLVDTIDRANTAYQMKLDSRFQERAIDAGLPQKYINDFRRVKDVPAFKPQTFISQEQQAETAQGNLTQGEASQLERTQSALTDVMEATGNTASSAYEWLTSTDFKAAFTDWYSGSGREERRRKRQQANELPTN